MGFVMAHSRGFLLRAVQQGFKAAKLDWRCKGLTVGGIFLGFHPDGERPRLFQPQSYSLQNVLAAERKARAKASLVKAFFSKALEVILVIFRTVRMVLVASPLVITSPLALYSTGFRNRFWFALLVYTIERCGPVYVKLGQWAATRRDLFPQEMCERLAKVVHL